jgi:hypothetical protein
MEELLKLCLLIICCCDGSEDKCNKEPGNDTYKKFYNDPEEQFIK